jgi:hypothetical protein
LLWVLDIILFVVGAMFGIFGAAGRAVGRGVESLLDLRPNDLTADA